MKESRRRRKRHVCVEEEWAFQLGFSEFDIASGGRPRTMHVGCGCCWLLVVGCIVRMKCQSANVTEPAMSCVYNKRESYTTRWLRGL